MRNRGINADSKLSLSKMRSQMVVIYQGSRAGQSGSVSLLPQSEVVGATKAVNREKLAGILAKLCGLVAMGCGLLLDIQYSHPSGTEIVSGLISLGFLTGVLSLARLPGWCGILDSYRARRGTIGG